MDFIITRLNKDNFWNLIFWLGISLGCFAAEVYKNNSIFWISVFTTRYVVKKGTAVTYTISRDLINSRGEILNERLPNGFIVAISPMVGTFILRYFLDPYIHFFSNQIISLITIATFFFIPTVYFILKNCPIAVLFNFHAWIRGVNRA